jgi:nicotinamide mononucleotide (NMN) deamidase PncC
MSIRRLRALGVLAATSAIAVAGLGAPAGASAAFATGKLDVAVDTPVFHESAPTPPRQVRDRRNTVRARRHGHPVPARRRARAIAAGPYTRRP